MRKIKSFWLFLLPLLLLAQAHAQEVRIVSPQEGQDVRGEITVRYEGVPAGGYAMVRIDGQLLQASAQDFVLLDTISDRVTFSRGDAQYKLEVTVLNAGGKRVGTDSVTFAVANSKVDPTSDPVRMVHWLPADRLGDVQRYRVFAESNATISTPAGGAGASSGGGAVSAPSSGGAATSAGSYLTAPLDWQVSALLRRVVRDTSLLSGSANLSTIVQEAYQRQRLAAPITPEEIKTANSMVKGPWAHDEDRIPSWENAPETGKFYIKAILQNGTEINATRKAPTVAIADLLPTFLDESVRPGSTWQTTMSFVGELTTRKPINVLAPITFSAYEPVQTPAGETRRCAKLESRFDLTDPLAKKIAANLAGQVGSGGAAGAASGAAAGGAVAGGLAAAGAAQGAGGAGGTTIAPEDIEVASTRVARVLWFDVERRRVIRAEDILQTNFELPASAAGGAGAVGPPPGGSMIGPPPGMGGMTGMDGGMGAAAAPAEPTKVSYNLKVTTWLDDRVPNPTGVYIPGGAGAHARDSVREPGLTRVLTPGNAR